MTAKTGSGIAVVKACCKEGGIGGRVGISDRVGISGRAGIGASSSKDVFGPSIVYSRGVGE